jgi:hypothetical protein
MGVYVGMATHPEPRFCHPGSVVHSAGGTGCPEDVLHNCERHYSRRHKKRHLLPTRLMRRKRLTRCRRRVYARAPIVALGLLPTSAAQLSLEERAVSFPGHELRARRLELSLSTIAVSAGCAVPVAMIDALEAGALDRLPAPCYTVGFIRSYCRQIGLEPEYYVSALHVALNGQQNAHRERRPVFARLLNSLPIPTVPRLASEFHAWIIVIQYRPQPAGRPRAPLTQDFPSGRTRESTGPLHDTSALHR